MDPKEITFKKKTSGDSENQVFDDEIRETIKEKIVHEMKKEKVTTHFEAKDDIIEPILDNIEEIFQTKYQHLLSFFKLKTDEIQNSVDVAILSSLLKSLTKKSATPFTDEQTREEQLNYRKQIRLCLKWNRYDLAKMYMFRDENKDKIGPIEEFMYYAIQNNRHQFVKLFLENGFVIKNFLTYRRLLKLYNDVILISNFFHFI
jgi:hypothetical protein